MSSHSIRKGLTNHGLNIIGETKNVCTSLILWHLALLIDKSFDSALLDMAKKIKAEQHKISQTQCAQPRFAGPSSSAIKRKLDPEDDEDEDDDDSGSVQRGKS